MQWARETGKPIVLEDLDLEKKKKSGRSAETNRKVSAMAYAKISDRVQARAFDCGVTVLKVNPAYSSVQGQLKAVGLGLGVHGGAPMCSPAEGTDTANVSQKRRACIGSTRVAFRFSGEHL